MQRSALLLPVSLESKTIGLRLCALPPFIFFVGISVPQLNDKSTAFLMRFKSFPESWNCDCLIINFKVL